MAGQISHPSQKSQKQTFLGTQKPDCIESGAFPRCSYGKTTCLPSTGLLMPHSPDVLCWQPWQKALNLFIHTCLILSPHSTSQPVGLGRWMSETKATRGSGSGLSLNLNNSITHCNRRFRGHLNRGVWDRCAKQLAQAYTYSLQLMLHMETSINPYSHSALSWF